MRIGIDISCWLNRRGFGRFTRELVRGMLDIDPSNEYVLFLDETTANEAEGLPSAQQATRVTVFTGSAAARAAAADGSRSIGDLWRMRRAVKAWNGKLDVMYFPADYTYFPVSTTARVVVTKHDMTDRRVPELLFPTWRSRVLWNAKIQLAIRRADLVFTVSNTSKRDIVEAYRMSDDKVRVIPDAVDPGFAPSPKDARRDAVLQRHGIGANERFFLYVGGISPHKNLATLVRAFQAWNERGPDASSASLVLVGDYTNDVFHSSYQEIRAQIADAKLDAKIRFAGFVPDAELCDLYSAAEALVLPSLYEGFGLPVLEAMACGTPVIASHAGALREVVGDAGLLFDPYDADGLSHQLQRVHASASLRSDLAARGLVRASQYSWNVSAHTALAAFEEVAR